jgi:hypothetical protein
MWGEPPSGQFRQNINLVSEPFAGSLSDYVASSKQALKRTATDVDFGPEVDVKTCDNHPAHVLAWKSTVFGHKLVFVQAASVWFGRGYVLTYTYENGQTANNDAVQALATLCVRHG